MTTPTPPTYVDRFNLPALAGALANQRKAVQASDRRFWASLHRPITDTTREIVELRFSGPRQINYLSFRTAHFPHIVTAEWRTEAENRWHPFTARDGSSLAAVVTDSSPAVVTTTPDKETGHPQHTMAKGHWMPVYWGVKPIEATRVRLVLTRTPGAGPRNLNGTAAAYSLGVRDMQVGYRVNSAADIPRTGIVRTEEDTYGSSIDLLGSRVVFTTKRDDAGNVLIDSPGKFWRSEPQPVSYAVVNFYADTRDTNGEPTVIDRFYLDPLTVGPAVNVYWSNDEPEGDFEPSEEHIPFGALTTVGNITSTAEWLDFEGATDAHATVNNDALRLDVSKPWWLAMQVNPQFASTDPNLRELVRMGNAVLRFNAGSIEYVSDDGTLYSIPLPVTPTNADVRIVLAYNPTDDGVGRGYHVYWIVGSTEPVHLVTDILHPPVKLQALQIGGELSAFRLRALVLKPTTLTDDDLATFNLDPAAYVLGPDDHANWPGTAANSLMRFHPSGITPAAPTGFVGGWGDRYAGLVWTPVMRDYSLKQGFMFLPPTRAKFWKFEMTNLVPEHYEVFVPIRREVTLFHRDTVLTWQRLTNPPKNTPKPNTKAHRKDPAGLATLKKIASRQHYSDAVGLLGLLSGPSGSGYSPTESLYVRDPQMAQKLREAGWVWNFQPWHVGTSAPRFVQTQRHVYDKVVVNHTTKVGFFAGIKTLRAYRLDYLALDDTEQYAEHFLDDVHVASSTGISWPSGQVVSQSYTGEVISKVYGSNSDITAVQFATIQTEPQQVLEDENLREQWRWKQYGDAVLTQVGGSGGLHVTRGYYARTYGMVETQPDFQTYANLEGKLYGEIEGGQVNGMAGGGIDSEPYLPSSAGKVYVAVKVSAPNRLVVPITVQIVDQGTGIVLAATDVQVGAGELATVFATYTPGSVGTPLTYADMEAAGTYAALEGTPYGSHESRAITGPVFARVVQQGPTTDEFVVNRISLYDDPITWEFSVDGGATWYDAGDVRNNPSGVLNLPEPGTQLAWRLRLHRPGAAVSALAIRPWYVGHYGPTPPSLGLLSHGPNRNVNDHYGPIEDDPMWQQWDQPIPRSFYNPPPTIEATPETAPPAPVVPTGNLPEAVSVAANDSAPATDSATALIVGSMYDHDYASDPDGPLTAPLTVTTTGGGIDASVAGGALSVPNAVPESTSYVLMPLRGDSQYVDVDVASAGPAWTDGNNHFVVPLRWTDVNNHTEARVVLTPTGYSIEVWDFVAGVDTRLDFTQLTTHTIRPTLTHIHAEAAGTTVIVRADFSDPDIGSVALAVTTAVASGPEAGIAVNYGERFSRLTISSHI